jgi:hypothetical protein
MQSNKPSKIKVYNLDINVTHSTWVELMELMSWAAFFNLTFTGTCQWVFG